jgi:CRISPR-associated endonuclease Cas2
MSVYLVSYDLVKEKKNPKHDYQILWDELNRLGAFRTQYSLWLVNSNMSAIGLRQHFEKFVDENDRISTTKLFKDQFDYRNAIGGTNKWLAANPPESR